MAFSKKQSILPLSCKKTKGWLLLFCLWIERSSCFAPKTKTSSVPHFLGRDQSLARVWAEKHRDGRDARDQPYLSRFLQPFKKKSRDCNNVESSSSKSNFPANDALTATTTNTAAAALIDMRVFRVMWKTVTKPLAFLSKQFLSLTPAQKLLLLVTFVLGFAVGRMPNFWKRYTNVMDIPGAYFGPYAQVLRGRAVKVTDGDTIRFLHQPNMFHPKELAKGQKLSEFALPIRVCSIDTPETAKFGKPGQPFGEEAKEALAEFLDGKQVYIRLLQKDQYMRAVAQIFVRGKVLRRPLYVDEHLLKRGLAEVYRGGGAVYGPKGLEAYNEMEQVAQSHKLGIWSQDGRESAAEFKKRTKDS